MNPKKLFLSLVLFFFALAEIIAQFEDPHLLFVINRNRDADEIHYAVNLDKSGNIDEQNPIRVFWVKHSEGGKQAPLTWIQNRYAYGVGISKTDTDEFSFYFVSKTDQYFKVRKDNTGRYRAFTNHKNITIRADSLYIQFDGGSFLQPGIAEIKVYGQDSNDGQLKEMTLLHRQ